MVVAVVGTDPSIKHEDLFASLEQDGASFVHPSGPHFSIRTPVNVPSGTDIQAQSCSHQRASRLPLEVCTNSDVQGKQGSDGERTHSSISGKNADELP